MPASRSNRCFHKAADRQIESTKIYMDEQLKRFDKLLKAEGKTYFCNKIPIQKFQQKI